MFIFLDVKRAKISTVAPNKTKIKAFQRQTLQIDFFYGFYYGFFVGIKGYFDNALPNCNEKNRKNNKIINNKVAVILLLVIVAFLLYIHRIVIFIVGNPNSQQRMGVWF